MRLCYHAKSSLSTSIFDFAIFLDFAIFYDILNARKGVINLHERIKKLRKVLDLTQREFGERIGVKPNTIATYEIGRNEPIDAVISLIRREFNVNERWLRTGEGGDAAMFVQRSRDDELSAFVNELMKEQPQDFRRRLVTALSRLKPEQWDALESIALSLMEKPAAPAFVSAHTLAIEEEARSEADEFYRQRLMEKKQEAVSSASPSDTGSGGEKMA